jgi:hypothetical protein
LERVYFSNWHTSVGLCLDHPWSQFDFFDDFVTLFLMTHVSFLDPLSSLSARARMHSMISMYANVWSIWSLQRDSTLDSIFGPRSSKIRYLLSHCSSSDCNIMFLQHVMLPGISHGRWQLWKGCDTEPITAVALN